MKTTTTWETIVDTLIQELEHDGYKKGEKMPSERRWRSALIQPAQKSGKHIFT